MLSSQETDTEIVDPENHNTDLTEEIEETQEESGIHELMGALVRLRAIKRLVGGLEADEDDLEQVWRWADEVQLKIEKFIG